MLRKLFRILTVQSADLPRVRPLLDTLLRVTIGLAAGMGLFGLLQLSLLRIEGWILAISSSLLLGAALGLQKLGQKNRTSETVNLLLAAVTLYITVVAPPGWLVAGPALILYGLPIAAAALLLTPEASPVWAAIATLTLLVRAWIVANVSAVTVEPLTLVQGVVGLHVLALLSWLLGHSLQQTQRTLRRQIEQKQTGVEIGYMVTSALDLRSITSQSVQAIKSAFNYCHVGLYVLDPESDMAVLMEAAGEAASHLKESGFRVPLDGKSVVAAAIREKKLRTLASWQERRDPHSYPHFQEEALQFTYSRLTSRVELAIPLLVRGQVVGALDLHSVDVNAFPDEEIHTLEGVAGNIANALETSRLFDDLQRRHQELESVYTQTERRTRYLEATAELARAISSLLDPQELLDRAVHLVSEGLGVYHTGIFLLDEPGEWAILIAANSEGGKRMLARGHKLRVGEQGFVGRATGTGQPYIGLDVGEDAVHFANPDLPDTRSEIALPLKVGDRVIGALDVQSMREAAFGEEDVAVLQTLADQIAIALENARLFQETQQALQEMAALQRYYVAREWEKISHQQGHQLKADYCSLGVPPPETDWTSEMQLALEREAPVVLPDLKELEEDSKGNGKGNGREGQASSSPQPRSALAVPIKLRDEVIGVLDIQETDESRHWTEEEVEMTTAVADQLALALENARLFDDARTRAEELAVLNELGQKLTSCLDIEGVLEEVYRQASRLVDTSNLYIILYDEKSNEVTLAIDVIEGELTKPRATWKNRQGFIEYVIRNRSPVIAQDTYSDWADRKGLGFHKRASLSSRGVRIPLAVLGVPLIVGDQVLGVIAIRDYANPRAYDAHDQELLTSIAHQTAIALQNAHLFEEAQRRATQLAAAAEVARDATSILNVDQLLDETVHLISAQFNFYHAGVFLLDDKGEYAVLHAASSEGGKCMLERGHKLPVGKVGIVGHVAATGEPRIALDVGEDVKHFVNPDLPNTRSEMGLPLKVHNRVIGVLDVQSTAEGAFSEEDIAVMQTLADQLAAAIANARLFQEVRTEAVRRALINEVHQAATTSLNPDELLHRAGEVISRRMERASTVFSWEPEDGSLRPVAIHDRHGEDIVLTDEARLTRQMSPTLFYEVVDGRRTCVLESSAQKSDPSASALIEQMQIENGIFVPLTARDQILGALALAQPEAGAPEDREFIEIVGANLSVALENARLYQEAVKTAEKLQEMDRLKSQFLANMSHELRTPLNSIIGFSRVILKGIDGPLTDMQRTDLEAVYNSGQHLLGLINDILDISKIQAGKMELSIEETDLNEIINGVMSTAIALVKDKPIELQQTVPPDLPKIQADSRRIRQVLLNLVGNAAKFTEEGFIRVEAETTPTEVIISVADSGVGIPEDKLESVFEEFTQVDGSSTRAVGGTGLGLAITARFVEMHGGRIWVESEVGVGSTFYVALPFTGPSAEEPEEPEAEEPEADRRVVLCVDDDEGVITLFRRYLSKQGYRVIGLTDSITVLERARQLQPFAITLDVMMPDKDGWQVIQELKADPDTRHIPVIMCTIVSDKDRGISLGASAYLVKPILEDDLVAALERLDREEGHHRVLVVDDHTGDRKLLRRMIESQEGYEVIEASGGQEAIHLVQKVRPHIIVLDLMMPDVDGFAVLEAVKSNKSTRSIPIIVVTAKELTAEERGILNSRVESLLQKGLFEKQELLADVAATLERFTRRQTERNELNGTK